jgi:hypothetical protein
MAEIFANGQTLGTVTSSFYINSGPIRSQGSLTYLDRNMTITPQFQPASPVKIRLYMSKAEFDALDADPLSGITSIADLRILKNNDPCISAVTDVTTIITPTFSEAHGANGYMLQADITGFSSFYFASSNFTLPLDLLSFTGSLQTNGSVLLNWKTENENKVSHFVVERSLNGVNYTSIGQVQAKGNAGINNYSLSDDNAGSQPSLVLYYRLKMTDIDGTYKYSNIVRINISDITGKVTVAPNPVQLETRVNIKAPEDGNVQWKLYDQAGRVALQGTTFVSRNTLSEFSINMRGLSAGPYFLNITGAGINKSIRLQRL